MGQPRFEIPTGAIDGVNKVFTLSMPYVPGSTAVWLNGLLLERTLDDGWTETDPSTGVITLTEAPRGTLCPDVIQVFYKDTSDDTPETVVENICGVVEAEVGICGVLLQEENILIGTLGCEVAISGNLLDNVPSQLTGTLEPIDELTGVVIGEDC